MTASRFRPLVALAPAAIAATATALFLAPWWNRFLRLTLDGYFPLYGRLIADGRVPYRDFFFHLPPLQALIDGWVRRDRHRARSGGKPSRERGRPPGEPLGVAEFTAPAGLTVLSSNPAPGPSPAAEAGGTIESNPRGERP